MMKIPKDLESRYISVLLPGIPTANIKVSKVTDDEITGVYEDGEEIHISQDKLLAYWINTRRESRKISGKKASISRSSRRHPKSSESNDLSSRATITQDEENN
jgi:hypothetical protein